MFDRLSDGFNAVFRKLSGQGTISEANVREAMADVETALLEADVHYDVVKAFCKEVVDEAMGSEVTKSLKPGQEMIGIVHAKLVDLLGGTPETGAPEPGVMRISPGPTIVMMCGLQGSGKTTTCAKLAAYLKKRGRSVMLCAADLQRPAAVEQLETVARQVNDEMPGGANVSFYAEPDKVAEYGKAVGVAVKVCQNALKEARKQSIDTLILDTAGRLHVDDDLMGELRRVDKALSPHQIFLVVDAMTGQDAVNSAKAFHEQLAVDGVILTKFDSDTRGGAALSVKQVTGAPLRFIGVGEKLDAIEEFHAERMAGRILGMGDVVSLVEKAQEEVTEEEAMALQEKMAKGEMTMDDFVKQLKTIRRMGPDEAAARHAARRRLGAQGRRHRRRSVRSHRGDHLLDDQGGAQEPEPHQRAPAQAHRQGQWHRPAARRPARQAVLDDEQDEQADVEHVRGAEGQRRQEPAISRHGQHDARHERPAGHAHQGVDQIQGPEAPAQEAQALRHRVLFDGSGQRATDHSDGQCSQRAVWQALTIRMVSGTCNDPSNKT